MNSSIPYKAIRRNATPKLIALSTLLCLIIFALAARGTEDQQRIREVNKWNGYVELNNDMPRLFFQPLEYYFAAFGRSPEYKAAAEQQLLDSFVASLPPSEDFEKGAHKILGGAKEADDELDEAAKEMLPHFHELLTLLAQSRSYHAAQTYSQDDYAQAAELHARIHAAHAAFLPSYQKFSQVLHIKDAERRKTDIEAMLAQNLRIKPALLRVVDAAQNIQDYFNAQMITAETILNLEPDTFMALFHEYISASDTFLALGIESNELIREGLREDGVDEFRHSQREVLAAAEPIMAYCQNLKKDAPTQPIKLVDTKNLSVNIEKLVDIYNTTIK
jgi:hypothetical protein